MTQTHRRTGAQAHSGANTGSWSPREAVRLVRLCVCAALPLCVCASVLCCTDPRARVEPPTVRVTVSPIFQVHSPGTIPTSVYAYDVEGFDSVRIALRSSVTAVNADSLLLFPDTTEATTDVVWAVPSGVPLGTQITVFAKVWNLVGFGASDSVIVTIQ